MKTRRVRAGIATSGTLGLILTGLYGPLGIGSARDDAGETRPHDSLAVARHADVDARGGTCPEGSFPSALAHGLDVCLPVSTASPSACSETEPMDAIHVAPGGDGDGTRERPVGSIEAALRAHPDATIVLAAGGHRAPSRPLVGRTILGRCGGTARILGSLVVTEGTTLDHVAVEGTLRAHGAATLRHVRLTSSAGAALEVLGDARVEASDLVAHGAPGVRLSGEGASLSFTRLRARSSTGEALLVERGAQLRGDVIDARGATLSLLARGESTLVALEHAQLRVGRLGRETVRLEDHADVRVSHSLLEAGSQRAVSVDDARLAAEGVIVMGPSETLLALANDARATLEEVGLVSPIAWAIDVDHSTLEARGFVVSAHLGMPNDVASGAVHAHAGAQVSLDDGLVTSARGQGVLARGEHTSVRARSVSIVRTRAARCATSSVGCDGPPGGHAMAVTDGARLDLRASWVTGSDGCGLVVRGDRSRVTLEASELRDNRVALCGDGASGEWLTLSGDVALEANESLLARPRVASAAPPSAWRTEVLD